MRGKFIHHVTLTTGHTRRSYRAEVEDDVVAICRQLIDSAIEHESVCPVAIPGTNLCLTAHATSKSLTVTVWRGAGMQGDEVCTFGVAAHSMAGAKLWRRLVETASTPITAIDCPPEPWCAARLEMAATKCSPDELMMLGDFERCIAWAFLERA